MNSPVGFSFFQDLPPEITHKVFSHSTLSDLSTVTRLSTGLYRDVKSFVKLRANVLSREMKRLWDLAEIVNRQILELTGQQSFLITPQSGALSEKFTLDDQSYQRFHTLKSQCSDGIGQPLHTLDKFQRLHQSFHESFVDALCSQSSTVLNQIKLENLDEKAVSLFHKSLEASRNQVCANIAVIPVLPQSFYGLEVNPPPCLRNMQDVRPPITIQTAFSYCNAEALDENNTLIHYGLPSRDGPVRLPFTHFLLEDLIHLKDGHTLTVLWQTYDNSVLRLRVRGSQKVLSEDPSMPRWASEVSFQRSIQALINRSIEDSHLNGILGENPFAISMLEYGREFLTPSAPPEKVSYTFSRFSHNHYPHYRSGRRAI